MFKLIVAALASLIVVTIAFIQISTSPARPVNAGTASAEVAPQGPAPSDCTLIAEGEDRKLLITNATMATFRKMFESKAIGSALSGSGCPEVTTPQYDVQLSADGKAALMSAMH